MPAHREEDDAPWLTIELDACTGAVRFMGRWDARRLRQLAVVLSMTIEAKTQETKVMEVSPCPYCSRQPDIDECDGLPKSYGPPPWYAACYVSGWDEHVVAVNGDDKSEAIANWNAEVSRLESLKVQKP